MRKYSADDDGIKKRTKNKRVPNKSTVLKRKRKRSDDKPSSSEAKSCFEVWIFTR